MAQGKCNLLKPVDCATGTFFMFSQTAQDLTCEFTQADTYRVVPSKFAALDLDLSDIAAGSGSGIDWDSIDWLNSDASPAHTREFKMQIDPDIPDQFGGKRIIGDEIFIGFPSADFGYCSITFRQLGAGAYFELSQFTNKENQFTIVCGGVTYTIWVYNVNGSEVDTDDSLTEKTLGQVFQNYFENACTHIRASLDKEEKVWRPDYSLPILWNTLEKYGLIKLSEKTAGTWISDNLKYIGDINIYSYNPTSDGIGYSEIYCYIPNEATSMEYPMHFTKKIFDAFPLEPDATNIHGYEGDATATYTGLHWMLDDPNIEGFKYYDSGKSYSITGIIPDKLNYFEDLGDDARSSEIARKNLDNSPLESFSFNAVLVMYNIVSKGVDGGDDKIIYHDVPLGIYFTGKPEGLKLTNTITKFVNSEDIYNQGTAYGLRICSRFLCSPNLTKFEDVEVSSGDYDAVFTEALSKMAENVDYFKELAVDINSLAHELTTHLANFRNNKVNVPYLRNLNGTYYWFVNGKNTGVPANSITKEEVDEMKSQMDRIEYTLVTTIKETMAEMNAGLVPMGSGNSYINTAVQNFKQIIGVN